MIDRVDRNVQRYVYGALISASLSAIGAKNGSQADSVAVAL